MNRLVWTILLTLALVGSAFAQAPERQSVACPSGAPFVTAAVDATFSGAGDSQLVAGAVRTKILLYRWWIHSDSGTVAIKFTEGTGTNCGTGTANVTGVFHTFAAAASDTAVDSGDRPIPLSTNTAANALCLNSSAAAVLSGFVVYCRE
jgi:hypothetical protein